jgi:hypothetical protein
MARSSYARRHRPQSVSGYRFSVISNDTNGGKPPLADLWLIFESFGTPEWVMKTVPILMAAGLLFALFEPGRQSEFEAGFTELRDRWDEVWPIKVAHVYAWTGDTKESGKTRSGLCGAVLAEEPKSDTVV